MMKFNTNIGYGKLYCVRKNQPYPAYQSLYLSIFLSLWNFCHRFLSSYLCQLLQILYTSRQCPNVLCKRKSEGKYLFSILFPLCSFSICHSCIMNREISVKNFSGTARHRMMKFDTNIGYGKLYCVRKNQPSPAYQSLYLSIFLSL